jgi:hypothetical protein
LPPSTRCRRSAMAKPDDEHPSDRALTVLWWVCWPVTVPILAYYMVGVVARSILAFELRTWREGRRLQREIQAGHRYRCRFPACTRCGQEHLHEIWPRVGKPPGWIGPACMVDPLPPRPRTVEIP